MKHKKKHKEDRQDRDRKHKEDEKKDEEKEKCLTQKLSINLKRLSGTYTTSIVADATSTTSNISEPEENDPLLIHDDDQGENEDVRMDDRDEDSSEEVPDFPPGPLRLKLTAKNLHSALGAEGNLINFKEKIVF